MLIKSVLKGLVLLSIAAIAAAIWLWNDYRTYVDSPAPIEPEQTYHVEKGMYYNALIKDLNARNIIKKPVYMRIMARLQPNLTRIKAGEYRLEPGMTPRQIIEKMVRGDTLRYQFTIIEGTRWSDLRNALAREQLLDQQTAGMNEQQISEALGLESPTPEGMFLAETYQFERGMSDLDLLTHAHQALKQTLERAWSERKEDLPLKSPYEALILASIVEKETAVPEERPRIAGVFVRRLSRGMRLQTDPTVIYGMGEAYKGNIRRSDLRRSTPYNTYVIDGLPPTPIAMVGADAIEAAVNPAPGTALYFVAKGDGSHRFSDTLAEHNKAVARYQLKRKENYRSSPEN